MIGEIKVKDVTINEDGGATYSFDLDETSMSLVQEEGLKLLLYCGLAKTDIQDVYDWILSQEYSPERIREMTVQEKQRAKEKEAANKCTP